MSKVKCKRFFLNTINIPILIILSVTNSKSLCIYSYHDYVPTVRLRWERAMVTAPITKHKKGNMEFWQIVPSFVCMMGCLPERIHRMFRARFSIKLQKICGLRESNKRPPPSGHVRLIPSPQGLKGIGEV